MNNRIAFYRWAMVNGWSPELEIDRKDSNGHYCPENCRFITEQKINGTAETTITSSASASVRL
jgi:hypothetical protein